MNAKSIKRFFKSQTFNPTLIGLFTNPFFFTRRALYDGIAKLAPNIQGRILDVGCGQKPYRHLFTSPTYIGVEVQQEGHDHTNEQVDFFYDGKRLPFDDATFDSIITSEVLEHVFEPDEFLQEIHRNLKPGGKLLLTAPFVWDEHEQPYDYARYTSFGLKHLLQKNGFKVIQQHKTLNDTRIIFQLISLYIFKKTLWARKTPAMNIIATCIFNAWLNISGSIIAFIIPSNNDLYFGNIVLAEKHKTPNS